MFSFDRVTQLCHSTTSQCHARLFATPWIVACTKLLCPWDFQGKSTGGGCHFLFQKVLVEFLFSSGDISDYSTIVLVWLEAVSKFMEKLRMDI